MQKLKYLIVLTLLFYLSEACSDSLNLPSEAPTNEAPFVVTLTGYRGSSPPYFRFIGTDTDEGEINVYAYVQFDDFAVPSSYVREVEIGPFASGSYTINYYMHGWDEPFQLQDSQTIVIEKFTDSEPPLGRIITDGQAVEDQMLRVSHTLNDRNGMGEVSYQWYRNGEVLSGAVGETYLLTDEDVHQDLRVTASYVDGLGNEESISSLPIGAPGQIANINDEPMGSVYIRGTVSEESTLTIDTSGLYDADGIGNLSYQWKRRYRAYSTNDQDIGLDSDTYVPNGNDTYSLLTAIVSYTDLHGTRERVEANITGPVVPASRPIVTAPADLSVPATGSHTLIDVGTATAHDDEEGTLDTVLSDLVSNGVNIPLPSNGLLYLQPGTHLLTWSATDSNGVTGEAIQIVRVDPIIEFGGDHSSTPEGPFICMLVLNGPVAQYPISVPYTVSATLITDQSLKVLHEGTFRVDGNEQSPTILIPSALIGDAVNYETLLLVMDQPTHAVMGDKTSCRIILSSHNFPPRVTLHAYQEEVTLRIVSQANGAVTVSSIVDDLNMDDTHTYDWSETDEGLTDIDSQEDSLTFDPASLEPGLYRVRLRVSDGSATHGADLSIRVVAEGPELSGVDSDGDGESDLDEGIGDRDGDGIPDYLDHAGLWGNLLSQEQGSTTQYLMETEPGLALILGDIAFFAGRHAAM
ncbi:MAG: hypothetical protein KZQ82_15705, partial [Candidatus Thiodiazotropha sp. (ex Lucinoma annulata)]|nr:hypothetical protein [Candidatus Thiodiazotropha sp. (ex Lucinoma annulata)]